MVFTAVPAASSMTGWGIEDGERGERCEQADVPGSSEPSGQSQ